MRGLQTRPSGPLPGAGCLSVPSPQTRPWDPQPLTPEHEKAKQSLAVPGHVINFWKDPQGPQKPPGVWPRLWGLQPRSAGALCGESEREKNPFLKMNFTPSFGFLLPLTPRGRETKGNGAVSRLAESPWTPRHACLPITGVFTGQEGHV